MTNKMALRIVPWLILLPMGCQVLTPDGVNQSQSSPKPSQKTDIGVYLDFGLKGNYTEPCFCVAGPCQDLPALPAPMVKDLIKIDSLPFRKTYRVPKSTANQRYHIRVHARSDAYNQSEFFLNGKSIGKVIHSKDHYFSEQGQLQNILIEQDSELELEVTGNVSPFLRIEFALRPEDPRLHHCVGEAQAWTKETLSDWQSLKNQFAPRRPYAYVGAFVEYSRENQAGHLTEFSEQVSSGLLTQEQIRLYNAGSEEDASSRILKPTPKILQKMPQLVNHYRMSSAYKDDLQAISFSSVDSMYAFAVNQDVDFPGIRPGLNEYYGGITVRIFPTPNPTATPAVSSVPGAPKNN